MTGQAGPGADFVAQELRLSHQLVAVLAQEQSALVHNDIDALLAATAEKSRVVQSVLAARRQLQRELAAQGEPSDEESVKRWLHAHRATELAQHRDRLLALQQAARQANVTNGLLIQRLWARNQAALTALHGQRNPDLYGADGQRKPSNQFARFA